MRRLLSAVRIVVVGKIFNRVTRHARAATRPVTTAYRPIEAGRGSRWVFGVAAVGMGVPVMSEAAQFGTGQVFLSMLWFFLFLIWICLLVVVFADIFRSHDLGGWAKALWTIFVIVLPYLGVFVYLIARGGKMSERRPDSAGRTAWHATTSGVASDMAVTERRVT
jgi:uncharacterized membrane protein YccF (DUF307 family)